MLCCGKLGDYDRFIGDCVDFVTSTIPGHVQPNGRFDFLVLSIGLLINLVEPCNANRRLAIAYVTPNGERTLTAFTKVSSFFFQGLTRLKNFSIFGISVSRGSCSGD